MNGLLGSYRDNVDRIVVPSRFFIDKFVEWGWPQRPVRPHSELAGRDPGRVRRPSPPGRLHAVSSAVWPPRRA